MCNCTADKLSLQDMLDKELDESSKGWFVEAIDENEDSLGFYIVTDNIEWTFVGSRPPRTKA